MIDTDIQGCFRDSIQSQLRLVPAGSNRYYVSNPFIQDDGDHLAIRLEYVNGQWVFTDGGSTYMRLSYRIDLDSLYDSGTRSDVVQAALRQYGVRDDGGILVKEITQDNYGRAVLALAQAMIRIMDVMYLSWTRVASTFVEDFRALVKAAVPPERYTFDWHDAGRDPSSLYVADCQVNGTRMPLYLFALSTNDRVRSSTITIMQYKMWNLPMRTVGIYEDMASITERAASQLNAHCDQTYRNMKTDSGQIINDLTQAIA